MALVQVYKEPTVLLAKRVSGEEEVPEGVVAVLTPDAPDVLSHVSVRARNMKVGSTARSAAHVIMLLSISGMHLQSRPQHQFIHPNPPCQSAQLIEATCLVLLGSSFWSCLLGPFRRAFEDCPFGHVIVDTCGIILRS